MGKKKPMTRMAWAKGKDMTIINIAQPLSNATWSQTTTVTVSRGNGDLAAVKVSGNYSLAEWLNWQVGTRREGTMNAKEYVAANKQARNADKAMAGWCSFAYYINKHRNEENWQGSNIVVLDADAKHGKNESAAFSFNANELRKRLDGLQFIALPTHSYTDEIPRWRIVITLSEALTNRDEFGAIARHLASRLDGYVDPRSYTPEQLWFSMSAPKGEFQRHVDRILVGE